MSCPLYFFSSELSTGDRMIGADRNIVIDILFESSLDNKPFPFFEIKKDYEAFLLSAIIFKHLKKVSHFFNLNRKIIILNKATQFRELSYAMT